MPSRAQGNPDAQCSRKFHSPDVRCSGRSRRAQRLTYRPASCQFYISAEVSQRAYDDGTPGERGSNGQRYRTCGWRISHRPREQECHPLFVDNKFLPNREIEEGRRDHGVAVSFLHNRRSCRLWLRDRVAVVRGYGYQKSVESSNLRSGWNCTLTEATDCLAG